MSGGGGTTTQTVQSGPPQAFIDAYQQVNQRAQQVAQQNYQPYPGNTVAGLSPDQQAGIGTIQSANGIAQPYINTAAQYINNSTKPLWDSTQQFSPEAVAKYQSPYTKNVVDTTRQLFNEQNQEQQQGVIGDAISRGAWGGDRSAVAQGILARNQQLAQAPVLAGLENQGYAQALQEFNQQQGAQLGANQANAWLNSQAGAGMANLGNQALQTTLAGGNALLGVGNLEQAQAQAELNVPFQQWQAAQAYPFQTTSWLANIAEGLGGASGGTSSTTSPGPNVGSQIAGAGIAAVGAANQAGLFGSGGGSGGGKGSGFVDSGAWTVARGGGVPRRAAGGIAGQPPFGENIPDLEVSVIPGADGLSVIPAKQGGSNLLNQSTGSTSTGQGPDTTGQQVGQAIGTIASIAALAFSDRRLKEDIAHVGWLKDGTPVHRYRYKGNPQWHIGVIAQEAEKNHPDAVHETPHGIKMVDNKALTDDSAGHGILQFPHHRTRMGRGILAANDDIGNPAEPQRAAGGIIGRAPGGVTVSMVPGSYAGSPMVPVLGGGGGGGTPAPAGVQGIMDYLAASRAGAHFGLPDTWKWTPPPPSAAPTEAQFTGNPFAGWSAPPGGGLEGGGGGGGSSMDVAEAGSGGAGVGGSHDMGQTEVGAGAAGNAAEAGSSGGGSSSSGNDGLGGLYASGGSVARRDDGGVLNLDLSGGGDPWQSDAPTLGSAAGDLPALDDYVPQPLANNAAVDIPQGGSAAQRRGIVAAPSPVADDGGSGEGGGAGNDFSPEQSTSPESTAAPSSGGKSDWGNALLYAGLGIMGGRSPHALTNIGAGALEGLKVYNQDKYRQELAKYREDNLRSLSATRSGNLAVKNRTADTSADRLAWKKQYDALVLKYRGDGLDERSAHNRAMEALGEQRVQTGQERVGATLRGQDLTHGDRLATADLRRGDQQLRRDALAETVKQHGIANDDRAQAVLQKQISGMTSEALRIYTNSKDPYTGKYNLTLEQAQEQARGVRGRATEQASPLQKALPPPPIGTVQGGYRFNGGDPADKSSWSPVQ